MTQDEFRLEMNKAKRENRLLWVSGKEVSGVALGYDSGTDEAVLFKDQRIPLAELTVDRS
jgi:hypothetical protein